MINKKKKKSVNKISQSGIITAVLLILLVIASIIVIWNVVLPLINKSKENADIGIILADVQIQKAKLYVTGGADIEIKRLPGGGNITSLEFIFYNKKGGVSIVKKDNIILNEMEARTFNFNISEINFINKDIAKVSVVPISGKQIGREAIETDSQIRKDAIGNRVLDAPSELVSWWKFEGDAEDSININHGKLFGNPKIENSSLILNGIDDYANIPHSDSINFNKNQNYAINAWVNAGDSNPTVDTIIEKWTDSGGPYPYAMRKLPDGYINCVINFGSLGGNFGTGFSITNFTNSGWHQVLCNFNNSDRILSIWVDGKFENSQSYNLFAGDIYNNDNLSIGSRAGIYYYNGTIDEIMIWNRSLSGSEIAALYNNQKS